MHAYFDGADTGVELLGCFVMAALVEIDVVDGIAFGGRQGSNGLVNAAGEFTALDVGFGGTLRATGPGRDVFPGDVQAPGTDFHTREVDGDAADPGAEVVGIAQVGQVEVGLQEAVLDEVFDADEVAEHGAQNAGDGVAMAPDEKSKGGAVTGKALPDEGCIVEIGLCMCHLCLVVADCRAKVTSEGVWCVVCGVERV